MTRIAKISLSAGIVAALAVVLVQAARRRGPSALSETLEHEDFLTDETEMGVDDLSFDARIAPGAPF